MDQITIADIRAWTGHAGYASADRQAAEDSFASRRRLRT